jgi:hypothetical protein
MLLESFQRNFPQVNSIYHIEGKDKTIPLTQNSEDSNIEEKEKEIRSSHIRPAVG